MNENKTFQLGDAPVEDKYRKEMEAIARSLDTIFNGDPPSLPKKTGFVLLVFPFGEGKGRCNYVSNGADRKDIVKMFREQIKRFEGQWRAGKTKTKTKRPTK